jgi:predicted lipid-binding transport protein (Tim44 family)
VKKFLLMLSVIFAFGLTTVAMDAEAAKRMGSGKSMGTQRQAAPDKAPTQTSAAPAAGAGAAAAPPRSWMGPVAGLAAGLGLAALASHLGFGEELASMLMMGLLAAAVMVVIGLFLRRRAAAQQGTNLNTGGMQYSSVGAGKPGDTQQSRPAYKTATPAAAGSMIGSAIGSGVGADVTSRGQIPTDFDVAGFERNAKVNFIRLQAANDAGDLNDIRQFTTPEMFAELKIELSDRGAVTQKTDVASVHARVVAVEEEAEHYFVSVRFTGFIKTEMGEADESFDEIWHMRKSRQGQTGWVLSGIQQTE